MTQPPQPKLAPRLGKEFPAEAYKNLELWCLSTRTSIELKGFLRGGKTAAQVAVVRVYDGKGVTIKVLKHCPPPEGGFSLDAQKYIDAQSANEKFTQDHLARLDHFVPDGHGGNFLLMEWRGGGSRNYRSLTSFLDRQTLGSACGAIAKSTLIDWQVGRRSHQNHGSVNAHEILQVIAGEKCKPGRSLYKIARELGISDADRLSANGTTFANVFRAVSQSEGFADFPTAGIRGNGHGDLHPGNILVPSVARPGGATEQFDQYYLIDLSSFDDNRFLAIDPVHLMLSLANERLSMPYPRQRDQLRELILDPDEADVGSVPFGIADAVRAISRVGRDHYDGALGLSDDWYQETLLAVAGCALLFVGRNMDPDTRWWFLQLGGMAIDKVRDFAAGRLGEQAIGGLPHGTTVTRPIATPVLPAQQDPPARQQQQATQKQPARQDSPAGEERPAEDGALDEAKDDNLIFISAVARRFDELKSACSRLCAELTEAVGGLEPYLARSRGIPGTHMVRDVVGDLTHSVAALRSWQEESPYSQLLSVDSAIALVEARLSTAAELAHEISVSGNTPTLKNKLSRAVVELNGAFQYFFAQIVPSKPDGL
jgi:hypothetical protein